MPSMSSPDGATPATLEVRDLVKKYGEVSLAGRGYPTPSNQCWPQGVPYIFWDFLMQMLQRITPDVVPRGVTDHQQFRGRNAAAGSAGQQDLRVHRGKSHG